MADVAADGDGNAGMMGAREEWWQDEREGSRSDFALRILELCVFRALAAPGPVPEKCVFALNDSARCSLLVLRHFLSRLSLLFTATATACHVLWGWTLPLSHHESGKSTSPSCTTSNKLRRPPTRRRPTSSRSSNLGSTTPSTLVRKRM